MLALVFLYQKIEIIKNGYNIDRNEVSLKKLIDENEMLRYNLTKFSSPRHLSQKIEKFAIDLELPKEIKIVRHTPASEYLKLDESKEASFIKIGKTFLSRLFLPKAEAEATIAE